MERGLRTVVANEQPVISSEDKTMAILAHVLGIFFGFIPALIIWLIKKDQSEYVNVHAKEALNFQISLIIYYLVAGILWILLVGVFLTFAIWIFSVVVMILATIKAANGNYYKYPLCIRLIK